MALFSNIFSCFSDSTQENRRGYLCNGEVCVLADGKSLNGDQKKQQSPVGKISFARLSNPMRKALSFSS
ncbi:hypothetical protein CDL15_Pgr007321 [Punica granatum]|uniref:Uncharacterized protein n=1 Tax=Punica granatum TaxID=22663 RepID=A0A218X8M3_PUNGR|nr:hypothetical protein CDL15_Pgr007321 [Punica granatum]